MADETCPAVHSHEDHLRCRYGSAYYHGIIRALWMWQLRTWQAARPGPGAGSGDREG